MLKNYMDGHRDRLRDKMWEDKLNQVELLELILAATQKRGDVKPIAYEMAKRFGNLYNILFVIDLDELLKIKGIGQATVNDIKLRRVAYHMAHTMGIAGQPIFHNRTLLSNYVRSRYIGAEIEVMYVLYLDKHKKLIYEEKHSKGNADSVAVEPGEIVIEALKRRAKFVVLMHNHPDGVASFSHCDMVLTREVAERLKHNHIELHDHLLFAGDVMHSAREVGWLDSGLLDKL